MIISRPGGITIQRLQVDKINITSSSLPYAKAYLNADFFAGTFGTPITGWRVYESIGNIGVTNQGIHIIESGLYHVGATASLPNSGSNIWLNPTDANRASGVFYRRLVQLGQSWATSSTYVNIPQSLVADGNYILTIWCGTGNILTPTEIWAKKMV